MKNVVFLVGSYFPNYSAVGKCQGNLADEFEKQGYNVTVITQKTYTEDKDEEWFGKQHIIRVMTYDGKNDLLCREKIKEGKKEYQIKHKYYQAKRVIKAIFSCNSLDKEKVQVYLSAFEKLDCEPDLLIPTCQPFDTVQAAILYKQEHSLCEVIPVVYDMFAESLRLQRFKWNKKLKMRANLDLERKMLEYSKCVFHVPSWTTHLKKNFADLEYKCKEIEHPLIVKPFTEKLGNFNPDKVNVVYTGVVDNAVRDPQYVLDFFSDVVFSDVHVHFYSLGSAQNKITRAARNSENIVSHGHVSNKIAHQAINSGGVLLSIGNKDNIQMPSKIFEYMSAGKPILHFSQVNGDKASEVLKKYPLSYVSDIGTNNILLEKTRVHSFLQKNDGKQLSFEEVRKCFEEADVLKIVSDLINVGGG